LVQSAELIEQGRQYLMFDDPGVLGAAKLDPNSFIASLTTPVTLDEVQYFPELFPAIKVAVDRRREAGRFLLTGSADVMLLPLVRDLERLIEPLSRGDPESALRWTCKSLRKLAQELGRRGHRVSHRLVAELLHDLGYGLQAYAKTLEHCTTSAAAFASSSSCSTPQSAANVSSAAF